MIFRTIKLFRADKFHFLTPITKRVLLTTFLFHFWFLKIFRSVFLSYMRTIYLLKVSISRYVININKRVFPVYQRRSGNGSININYRKITSQIFLDVSYTFSLVSPFVQIINPFDCQNKTNMIFSLHNHLVLFFSYGHRIKKKHDELAVFLTTVL